MSRIGKLQIALPEKVSVQHENSTFTVEGPKGKLRKTIRFDEAVAVDGGKALVVAIGT